MKETTFLVTFKTKKILSKSKVAELLLNVKDRLEGYCTVCPDFVRNAEMTLSFKHIMKEQKRKEIDHLFLRLWDKAVGQPEYNKAEWIQMQKDLYEFIYKKDE